MVLVGTDELSTLSDLEANTNVDNIRLLDSLLFCCFAAAVVFGRLKGFVTDLDAARTLVEQQASASDSQAVRSMLAQLPQHLREKVTVLLKRKRPNLDLHEFLSRTPWQNNTPDARSAAESSRRDSLEGRRSPRVVPGSYTQPMVEPESSNAIGGRAIDTQLERATNHSVNSLTDVYGDIVYTCASLFMSVAAEGRSFQKYILDKLRLFEEVSYGRVFLSCSLVTFKRVCVCLLQTDRCVFDCVVSLIYSISHQIAVLTGSALVARLVDQISSGKAIRWETTSNSNDDLISDDDDSTEDLPQEIRPPH